MKRLAIPSAILATAFVGILSASSAQAQATRTWVSGVGDDANPCSRTAPCKTFAGAISKTAIGGIINCIDPGGFGTLTINKSIEVDCLNTKAGMLAAGTNGVNIITAGIVVVLRGLSIEGVGTGLVGVNVTAAATVHIEKSTIRGFRSGNASGVRIANTSGNAQVDISDTEITDNGTGAAGGGVISVPTAPAFSFVQLRNVNVNHNFNGVANAANSRMRISHAVLSGNTTGVLADPGSIVTLNDTDIVFSNTGINGATTTFGNNRITGSLTSDGTAPTAAGAPSTDLGQK
jgi:hypothetical protein